MLINTHERRIGIIRKEINKTDKENVALVPNINLEDMVENVETMSFVNKLISMSTDITERKESKLVIVFSYGHRRLSRAKEKKLYGVLGQMMRQLEYSTVAIAVKVPDIKEGKKSIDTGNIDHGHRLILIGKTNVEKDLELVM